MFTCNRCGYNTPIKCNLKTHLLKKYPCQPVLSNIDRDILLNELTNQKQPSDNKEEPESIPKHVCEYCAKSFSKNSNLHRHLKSCKSKNSILNELTQKLKEKDEEIEKLKSKSANPNITNNTTNNTTINNQFVIINTYGNENLEYITKDYLTSLLKVPFGSIPRLVKQIYCNPNHPENQTVVIPNKKQPYVKVKTSDKWEYRDRDQTVAEIMDKGYNIIDDHYFDKMEMLKPSERKRFENFKDNFEERDAKLMKQLRKDAELYIINL